MVTGFVATAGLMLTVIGVLFKVNNDYCKRNDRGIEKNRESYHEIDKKLDILITTLEYKYPSAMKKAREDNGNKDIA